MVIKKEEVMYLDNVLTSIEQELNKYRSIIKNLMKQKELISSIKKTLRKNVRGKEIGSG